MALLRCVEREMCFTSESCRQRAVGSLHKIQMMLLLACTASVVNAAQLDFKVLVDVSEKEGIYKTNASFTLPIRFCQAYR